MSTTPVVTLHPDDTEEAPSLSNVPDFERPIAAKLKLVPGNLPDTVAHTASPNPILGDDGKIYVDDPSELTQPVIDHEVLHKIQARAGQQMDDSRGGEDYGYGGADGLTRMWQHGESIARLNSEQQAQALQDYVGQRAAFEKESQAGTLTSKDLVRAALMDKAYGPLLKQEQDMAYQGPGIDTSVAPPGPPPAALTGMEPPLPGMGGRTLMLIRPGNGQTVSKQTAAAYYQRAGGNPDKARAALRAHGWKIPDARSN